jgi:VanZ family protein
LVKHLGALASWRENSKVWWRRALWGCFVLFTLAAVVPYGFRAETVMVFSVGLDKLVHFAGFGFMAIAALGASQGLSLRKRGAMIAGVCLFGVLIEAGQLFCPYRTFNPVDIVANMCGVAFGVGVWRMWGWGLQKASCR